MSDQTPPPEEPPPGTPPPPPPPPPPPAPPSYGAPPPGGGSYQPPPPAGGSGYSAPDAISYGLNKFKSSPATLLVPALIVLVALIVVQVIVQLLLYATILGTHDCTETVLGVRVETECGPGLFMTLVGAALGGLFVTFISQLLGAGLIKSALNVVDGKEVNVGDIMAFATKPNVVTTAAILSAASFVGTLLCYFPAIIISFLTAFAMFYVVDKDMAPMDAIKASFEFVTGHLGDTIVWYLLSILTIIAGAILCLVGLLAAIPIVLAAAAYTFRVLNNEPVTPAE